MSGQLPAAGIILQIELNQAKHTIKEQQARIALLEAAIRKHKNTCWGSMKVRDPTARELYAALLQEKGE